MPTVVRRRSVRPRPDHLGQGQSRGDLIMLKLELSDLEAQIVRELLEREKNALPTERHHTDSKQLKEELRERQTIVTRLIERFETTAVS